MFVWTFKGVMEALILGIVVLFFVLFGLIYLYEHLRNKFRNWKNERNKRK